MKQVGQQYCVKIKSFTNLIFLTAYCIFYFAYSVVYLVFNRVNKIYMRNNFDSDMHHFFGRIVQSIILEQIIEL